MSKLGAGERAPLLSGSPFKKYSAMLSQKYLPFYQANDTNLECENIEAILKESRMGVWQARGCGSQVGTSRHTRLLFVPLSGALVP